jgi:ferrous iron transport protein B
LGDHVNITVALAGNPNSGKTSLFNELVGANQKVGNFSGVTVEKIEGSIKFKDYLIRITDLPGTYSLTAYSPEELVARNFIIETKPDVIVNVVDGTNLDRNLYLSTQLMELDKPFIIAINMYDEVLKNKTQINIELLSNLFKQL